MACIQPDGLLTRCGESVLLAMWKPAPLEFVAHECRAPLENDLSPCIGSACGPNLLIVGLVDLMSRSVESLTSTFQHLAPGIRFGILTRLVTKEPQASTTQDGAGCPGSLQDLPAVELLLFHL